jgi:hypothetical protein
MSEKPPLGLTPKRIWIEGRIKEISLAIVRYVEAGKLKYIPVEWVNELAEHIDEAKGW